MNDKLEEAFLEFRLKATPGAVAGLTVKFLARHSVGFIASHLAKTYCPTENRKQELQVRMGAYVIGGMAGDAAANWAQEEFNDLLDALRSVTLKVKNEEEPSVIPIQPTE